MTFDLSLKHPTLKEILQTLDLSIQLIYLLNNTSFLLTDIIQAKAIFITCEKYQKINKLTHLNQQIKKLCRELEDGNWESKFATCFLFS